MLDNVLVHLDVPNHVEIIRLLLNDVVQEAAKELLAIFVRLAAHDRVEGCVGETVLTSQSCPFVRCRGETSLCGLR